MSRPRSKLRQPLLEHMLSGGTPKEFGFAHGLVRASTQKLLWAMGLRKYYLTEAEYACVLARRRREAQQSERVAA